MKKFVLLITALIISYLTFAQVVGFNYKALVTNNGNPLSNASINVRFTIINGATTVYKEVHNGVSTDQHGIFSTTIGEGTPVSGTFSHALFRDFTYKLKVEIDTGSGYQDFGTEFLKTVPYAATAHHLRTTDRVWIGNNAPQSEKLFVKADPSGAELVEFYVLNTVSGNDVLQLTMDAPSSGSAQFIEAYTNGTGTVFMLNHDGSINMDGDLTIGGKIKTSTTGSADLKPYVYGEINIGGGIETNQSSSGFTAQKISTGKYKITLTGVSDSYYIPVVTPYGTGGEIASYQPFNGYFYVYITDDTGALRDSAFSFVVFRK